MQVMTKNHSGRYLQNLGICFKQGNPAFEKGNPASMEGNPASKKGNPAFRGGPIWRQNQDSRRPRSGQDWPGRNFPDLRFFAEVGRAFSRSEASRRSGVGFATGGLRGGRAADLAPGGFAEVGNASKAGPGG